MCSVCGILLCVPMHELTGLWLVQVCVFCQQAHLTPSLRISQNSQEGDREGNTDWGELLVLDRLVFFLIGANDSKTVPSLRTSYCPKFCLDIKSDLLKVMETTSASALKQLSGKLTLHEAPHTHTQLFRTSSWENLVFFENSWFSSSDKGV